MIFRYKIKFISDIEQKIRKLLVNIAVTPFVGVWIEITESMTKRRKAYRRSLCENAYSIIFYLVWVILIFANCHQYCSNDRRIYI